MSPVEVSALVTAAGVVTSWGGAVFIAGYRWGNVSTRLQLMEKGLDTMASKDQLSGVKEDVAEIKGMFRLALRDADG